MNLNGEKWGKISVAEDKRLFLEVEAGELNPAAAKSQLNNSRRAGANSTSSFTILLIQFHMLGARDAQVLPRLKVHII